VTGHLEVTKCDLKEGKSEMKKVVKKKTTRLVPKVDEVAGKVFVVRGHKVMLDSDLAELYEVQTKRLVEQVAISHDGKIEIIFEAIKELSVEAKKPRRKIGFKGRSKKK
jgi:hypothetical protein